MEKSKKKRKRLLSSAVAFILCLSMLVEPLLVVPALAADSSEASVTTSGDILNGAGEFNGTELDTTVWNKADNEGASYALESADGATGTSGNYLHIISTSTTKGKQPTVTGTFDVVEGTEYTLKFYIKNNGDKTTTFPSVILKDANDDTFMTIQMRTGTASGQYRPGYADKEWVLVTYPFTAGSDKLTMVISGRNGYVADFCIDEITLVDPSAATPEPTEAPTEAPTEEPTEAPTEAPVITGDVFGGIGEFESFTDGMADGWSWQNGAAGIITQCSDDEEETEPEGQYAWIQNNGVQPKMQGYSSVEVTGDTDYILTFYIKKNTTSSPIIYVYESETVGTSGYGSATVTVKTTDAEQSEWMKYTNVFTTGSTTKGLRIRVFGGSATDDFCIDGISIEKYDPSAATPTPTVAPATSTPTVAPTATPTVEPTATPTAEPTATPIATGDILGGIGEFEDFEAMGNGWNWYSGEKIATLCPDDDAETDPTGNYLQIIDGGSMQWASKVGDVEGETEYTLNFYIKRNADSYPYLQLAEVGTISTSFTTIRNLRTDGGTNTTANYRINGEDDVPLETWTPVEYRFTTSAGTNQLRIRVIGNGCTDYCLDGVTIVEYDSSAPTPTPTVVPATPAPTIAPENWVDILEGTGNFEERTAITETTTTEWRWSWPSAKYKGIAEYVPEAEEEVDTDDESPAKGVYLRITGSGIDEDGDGNLDSPAVRWSSLKNTISNGATYKLVMYIRRNSEHYPYIAITNNGNVEGESNELVRLYTKGGVTSSTRNYVSILGDENVPQGDWQKVEYDFTTDDFANRLTITVYGNDVDASFDMDGVSVVKIVPSQWEQSYAKWQEKLAEEEANGMLTTIVDDPTVRLDPIDGVANLLKDGDFNYGLLNWSPSATSLSLYGFPYGGTGLTEVATGADYIIGSEGLDGVSTDRCIEILPSNDVVPVVRQQVNTVEGGAEYQITFNYKIDKGSTSIPLVKIRCFTNNPEPGESADGDLGDVNIGMGSTFIADGKWHSFTYRTHLGPRVDKIQYFVCQQKGGNGSVYYDDVTFSKTGGAAVIALNDGMKIFYTDMQSESTEIEAAVDTTYYPEYQDGTVVFRVYKEKNVVWESESITLADGEAKVSFPLSVLTEKDTPYCVMADLYVGDELVANEGRNIYMYDRPSSLDENGRYVKFGEDFVPVLGYHVKSGEDLVDNAKVAEINVNVIQCGYGKSPSEIIKELNLLNETGQKGLVCLYTNMLPAGNEANAVKTIEIITNETIKNHPALFGYNVMDEPFVHQLDPTKDLENSYRLIRQFDQDNLVVFVEAMEDYVYETSSYADALITNPYWPAAGANVYKDSKLVKNSINFNKPVWGLFSTYVMDGLKTNGKGHFNTGDDVRNNNYQGLFAGLDGYGYFGLSDAGNVEHADLDKIEAWADITWPTSEGYIPLWEVQSPTDSEAGAKVWESLKSFEAVEVPIIAPYFIAGKGTKISEEINIDAGYMYHAWKAEDGTDYMVVLNVKGEDVHVNIPVESAGAQIIAGRDGDDRWYGSKNDKLCLDLVNVEALLLKLTDIPEDDTTTTPVDIMEGIGEFEEFELEDLEAGIPYGAWHWASNSTGVYEVCSDDDAQTSPDGQYLKINSNGSNAPKLQWFSKVGSVDGDAFYTLEFYIRRYSETKYPTFVLAESSGSSYTDIVTLTTQGSTAYSINEDENVGAEWVKCKYIFRTKEDTNVLRIRLTTHSQDTAGFDIDGITIVKIGGSNSAGNVASINGTEFGTLQGAIAAAGSGDVIALIANVDLGTEDIVLSNGILDLNGKALTVKTITIAPGTKIVDDSDGNKGIFIGEINNTTTTASTDAQVPVYDESKGGYVFADMRPQETEPTVTDTTFNLIFKPSFGTEIHDTLLYDGGSAEGIVIGLRISWTEGGTSKSQDLVYADTMVQQVYGEKKAFYINATGVEKFTDLTITPLVKSGANIEWLGGTYAATPTPTN